MKSVLVAAMVSVAFAISTSDASAAPPLVSKGVTVVDTADVSANPFGMVILPQSEVAGEATLSDGNGAQPQMTLLGCSFDVVSQPDNAMLQRAAPIFSRKLATAGDPPPAGFGKLVNPKAVGITDPVTAIGCSDRLTYFFFLFRQTPAYGTLIVETVVLEFDETGRRVFEGEAFDPEIEKPSIQTSNVVNAARGLYRMSFRTRDDAAEAKQQQEGFAKMLFLVAPKVLGFPF